MQHLTLTTPTQPATAPASPQNTGASTYPGPAAPHTHWENLAAIATAATVMSLGLYILKSSGAATGGTDGIALLLNQKLGIDLGAAVFLVALPFYGLGLWQKGWLFTLRSALTVAMISGLSYVVPVALGPMHISPVYGAIVGNVLLGLGILILVRHDASPAGTVIISLLAQETLGWRAGYVQFAIDLVIITTALAYAPLPTVLLSGCGAFMVGFILATNHRPGRYVAGKNRE